MYNSYISGCMLLPCLRPKTPHCNDKNGEQYDANQDMDSTTDFWGEYTLARK